MQISVIYLQISPVSTQKVTRITFWCIFETSTSRSCFMYRYCVFYDCSYYSFLRAAVIAVLAALSHLL